MATPKLPALCFADFGDQVDGVKGEIGAIVVKGPHDVNGETKWGVQAPNGHAVPLGLVDEPSGGGTFRFS